MPMLRPEQGCRPATRAAALLCGRQCCEQTLSSRTVKDIRDTLRSALGTAMAEELVTANVTGVVRLPAPKKRKNASWSAEEARRLLESARRDGDPLYAAYVLVLVLGLRRGEVLGLTWPDVKLDAAEVHITWQLQRAGGQLHHRDTKTAASAAVLPLPDIRGRIHPAPLLAARSAVPARWRLPAAGPGQARRRWQRWASRGVLDHARPSAV
jgi:integrase